MKPFPWKCGTCRERAVFPAIVPVYSVELEHDGRAYEVAITDFQVFECQNCGARILDDIENRRLSDGLRRAAGLLMPSEIRALREGLGLKQRELAAYLGIAESTLSRWETGAQIQQRAMDKFLRGFFYVEELRRFLGVPIPVDFSIAQTIALSLTQSVSAPSVPPFRQGVTGDVGMVLDPNDIRPAA